VSSLLLFVWAGVRPTDVWALALGRKRRAVPSAQKPGFATGMWRVPCARESSLFSSGRRPTGDRSVSGASGSGGRRRGRQEGVPPVRREAVTYTWKDRQLRLSTARPQTARGPSARLVHLAVYTRTEPRQPAPLLRWARSGEV